MASPRLVSALTVSWLIACGGKSFEVDQSPGGSSPGGSSPGGSSHAGTAPEAGRAAGGSANRAGAPAGGTGQGGSAGAECAAFDDEPGSFFAVEIHNQTDATIHLGDDMADCGSGALADYQVANASGQTLPRPGFCRQPCQTVREGGPVGCPAICGSPIALTLLPGEVYYTSWDGLFVTGAELPDRCLAQPEYYGGMCDTLRAIEPGYFTFSARAGHELTCATGFGNPLDPEFCEACHPSGNGGCFSTGAVIGGELITATSHVQIDSSFNIYGSFPPPAPAPFPGQSGEPREPPAPAVQIIFR